ncbi:probable palmitoyltransferase ZDHHC24 [Pollicipes pollicipes]|uniref:probable palmitoyltransferase ZDHHC24 n=1 Tax=Pollicipes pollicipes TaxID=41117 RepID=UPI001884D908|nr:probable palmitoyltransferase ZDHHC24 [Pollicipes pollicipes]
MRSSPSRWQERALSWFMTLGIPYALIWEGLVVLPSYYSSFSPVIFLHVLMGGYLVFIILLNFSKVIHIDTAVKPTVHIGCGNMAGVSFCPSCQVMQPVRSYHCSMCKTCIEKRDHHCIFTGCCVGLRNHRYFVSGVLAVFVGALYGLVYEWSMVVAAAGGYSLWLPVQLLAPHLVLPFGVLDLWGFVACAHHMLGTAVLVNAGVILYTQLSALLRGQTQYERKHRLREFDRGWQQNVRSVLGHRWLLALLWPLAQSSLPPDGADTEDGDTSASQPAAGDAAVPDADVPPAVPSARGEAVPASLCGPARAESLDSARQGLTRRGAKPF